MMRLFVLHVSVTFLPGHALAFLGRNPGIDHGRARKSTMLSSCSFDGKIFQLEERQGRYGCMRVYPFTCACHL
jgi:hypothetical protein